MMKLLPTLFETRENGRKAGRPSMAESRPPLFALFTITLSTPFSCRAATTLINITLLTSRGGN